MLCFSSTCLNLHKFRKWKLERTLPENCTCVPGPFAEKFKIKEINDFKLSPVIRAREKQKEIAMTSWESLKKGKVDFVQNWYLLAFNSRVLSSLSWRSLRRLSLCPFLLLSSLDCVELIFFSSSFRELRKLVGRPKSPKAEKEREKIVLPFPEIQRNKVLNGWKEVPVK